MNRCSLPTIPLVLLFLPWILFRAIGFSRTGGRSRSTLGVFLNVIAIQGLRRGGNGLFVLQSAPLWT